MDGPVYARPAISLIAEGLGPHNAALYIGGSDGASDLGLLRRHGITTVVNCAVNLDINLVQATAEEGDRRAVGYGDIRYYKLGLIDGEGSPDTMMLGAYYILDGALRQTMPKRETYPFPMVAMCLSIAAAGAAVRSRWWRFSCTSSSRTSIPPLTMHWR